MNRYFLVLIILSLLSQNTRSQNAGDTAFQIRELPKDGLLLNQHWIFHPEDDFGYANYNYKGKKGIPVNPALVLDELPQVEKAAIGWFRLKMNVDSSLRNKTIGMMLSLFGAAEIYLNGERVYKLGEVSTSYRQEKTQAIYGRAFTIILGPEEKQFLAVRYSHQPQNIYIRTGIVPFCLRIVLQPINDMMNMYAILVKRAYQFIGVALTIELASALLTLFFFFSFPSRKEYLYFGLYFCFNFLGVLVQSDLAGVGKQVQISVNELGLIQILIYLFLITGTLFHLNAMYALLQIKRTRYYRFLVWYSIGSMATLPFMPGWGSLLPVLFFPLACFELLPAYYSAAHRNFKGAWILFSSILLSFFFLLALIYVALVKDSGYAMVMTSLTMLTPALGIVIFLAGDFARTSLSLRARVAEVEALSMKTLAQEHDKQEILAAQKDKLEVEVQERTAQLRKSLADLKATQKQLMQSEKMALLGELTTGIAHEIQNPLNFVNNFSEVTAELIDEQKEHLQHGSKEEAIALADEIKDNLQKVVYHGKRADAIVKGMLEHSRGSKGEKQATDINALADECLRLSYHGFKAKDKEFTAKIETRFDESIGKIEVVSQDIGRVLLNLCNNAFYAVNEKKKTRRRNLSEGETGYEPWVCVQTKRLSDKIEIIVKDNGNGVSSDIADKIYQPFFTTKPAGQGTGLGLSLSYDIIKAHGGDVTLETRENEGARFIISIPK